MPRIASHQVVVGDEREPRAATLTITDGRISAIDDGIADDAEVVTGWLIPGYVDSHSHGAAGVAFADRDADKVRAAVRCHLEHGTTTIFASTVTESIDDLVEQIGWLGEHVRNGDIAGIHLEGPFLACSHKGAHNEALLLDPTPEVVDRLLAAGGDTLKMVTLAPELEHGMDAVERFARAGVMPAFGHTDGDHASATEAIDRGVGVVTHLFNAMNGIHHRKPGPIPRLLTDSRVVVELICDGVHVHPEVVRMAIDAAGVDRVALVTDAMAATGQSDGDYTLGTLKVEVRGGVARIATEDGSEGPIAGSTLTMDRAVEFVVQQVGCSIPEAVAMASVVPARLHQLTDVGQLDVGRWADACVVDDDGRLQRVMRRGEWIQGAGT